MRSRRTSMLSSLVVLACVSAVPILFAACKQPAPAVVDAGPPPPAPTDAAPAVLVPMDEDAGAPVPDAAVAHHGGGGPSLSANQVRAKQCCSAIRAAGKTDPMLSALAAQCDAVAMQMGPTKGGQAPEFAFLRSLPKLPAVCQGL